jgi:hypothetical protein
MDLVARLKKIKPAPILPSETVSGCCGEAVAGLVATGIATAKGARPKYRVAMRVFIHLGYEALPDWSRC